MSIRNQLGITQEQMAEILGISLSLLSMYELGKRDLPTHALVKLATLTNHVSVAMNKRKDAGVDKRVLRKTSIAIIDEMLAMHELKKRLLERQLKKMKVTEEKAFAAQQVALYEQQTNKEAHKNALEYITWQAEKKLALNNWELQLAFQYEIIALEGMINALKTHKDKL